MTVRIVCSCQTPIAFDVEPENGRMPVPIACPACGTDATPLADAFIASHAKPTIAPPSGPMRMSLRVAGAEPAAAPAAESVSTTAADATVPEKPRSSKEEAIARARIASEATKVLVVERASDAEFAFLKTHRLLIRMILASLVLLFGGWVWYKLVASKPKVVFTFTSPESVGISDARLVGERQLLLLTPQRLSLQDWKDDREVWSVALTPPATARPKGAPKLGNDFLFLNTRATLLHVEGSSVWLATEQTVTRYALATGTKQTEVKLPLPADSFAADDQAIVAISQTAPYQHTLTRVDYASGKGITTTHAQTAPRPKPRPAVQSDDETPIFDGPSVEVQFIPAGAATVALETELLERRIVTADNSQPESVRRKAPMLEKENLRAADSTEFAAEFFSQNGGAVEQDLSLFRVRLRRLFGSGGDWSGDVAGQPVFFATPTMDFLAAGTDLRALGKDGRVAWTAKLSHPIASARSFDDDEEESGGRGPVVVSGSRTYVSDQGTLTTLDSKTGKVAWRLPSVGISQVVPVGNVLYVATTSAGPESLKTKEGFRLNDRTYPIILKVEAATGKVLWSFERMADRIVAHGGFLYGARSASSAFEAISAASEHREAAVTYGLRRIDPENARMMWNWSQQGAPRDLAARKNVLLVRNSAEVKVLRFASF